MIGTLFGWGVIALVFFGLWSELREAAEKRSKLTPEQRRLQKLYAHRKRQPHPKRPGGAWAGRPTKKPRYDPVTQLNLF